MDLKAKLCPHCGSDNIGLNATVGWSEFSQCWEIVYCEEIDAFCRDCGREDFDPHTCTGEQKVMHSAALAGGWRHGGDNGGFWYDGNEFESWKAAASADDAATYETAEAVCRAEGLLEDGEG